MGRLGHRNSSNKSPETKPAEPSYSKIHGPAAKGVGKGTSASSTGFSFTPSAVSDAGSGSYTQEGPGPWGNKPWYDRNGMRPPPNPFKRNDWVLFYKVREKQANREVITERQRQCVEHMLVERARWFALLEAQRESVR